MFILIETLVYLALVYYAVENFSCKDIPYYLKLLIFLCWAMAFNIVIILPIDIFYVLLAYFSLITSQIILTHIFVLFGVHYIGVFLYLLGSYYL